MPPTMFLVKKLVERLPHPVAACPSNNTFTLQDSETGIEYLVDTGASRSLIPKQLVRGPHQRSAHTMRAANGSSISTYGTKESPLNYKGHRYTWKFLVADVFMPILGADFLTFYSLAVDVRNRRLIPVNNAAACSSDPFDALVNEFSDVFSTTLANRTPSRKPHGIQHHITTEGPPVYAKFRRLSPAKLDAAKKVFQELEDQGICQKASSPWSSPLHMVQKRTVPTGPAATTNA